MQECDLKTSVFSLVTVVWKVLKFTLILSTKNDNGYENLSQLP